MSHDLILFCCFHLAIHRLSSKNHCIFCSKPFDPSYYLKNSLVIFNHSEEFPNTVSKFLRQFIPTLFCYYFRLDLNWRLALHGLQFRDFNTTFRSQV